MAYAAKADLLARGISTDELIQITAKDGGASINEPVLAQALGDASARIDSYLAGRYTLPLASIPPLLVGLCADIARYLLQTDPPDAVAKRYDQALKLLAAIGDGTASLPSVEGPAIASQGSVETAAAIRIFGRDQLGGF